MSVHNEKEEHLRLAVESICNQTYENIEFIIIDDASNDECKAIIASVIENNSKIKLLVNNENIGLTASLNRGLACANGDYIARMDADDYSAPDRIAKQVKFMNKRSDIDICGTGVISFGDNYKFMSPHLGLENNDAQCMLFYSSTLCHPSVMMKKTFLDKYHLKYDETVPKGQDYDMWERCSVYGKLAVMPDVLLYYRTHSSQISVKNLGEQEKYANMVRLRRLERIGIKPTEKERICHAALMANISINITQHEIKAWIQKMIAANKSIGFIDNKVLQKDLNNRYLLYRLRNRDYSVFFNISYWSLLVKNIYIRISMEVYLLIFKQRIRKNVCNVNY